MIPVVAKKGEREGEFRPFATLRYSPSHIFLHFHKINFLKKLDKKNNPC